VEQQARFGLIVDPDRGTRRLVAPLLAERSLEAIHATTGCDGLDVLQKLPASFRVVLVCLELPDVPGAAVIETLRLFRPDIPVVCLSDATVLALGKSSAAQCVPKPLDPASVASHLQNALAGVPSAPLLSIPPDALSRARGRYAATLDLVEAAQELARALAGDEPSAW
jgi:DNA-binding response OmpR family regulator